MAHCMNVQLRPSIILLNSAHTITFTLLAIVVIKEIYLLFYLLLILPCSLFYEIRTLAL
jgi:hypothetical protein